MGEKPDGIKGGQGSIKVGATGRVSALMTRELEDCNSVSQRRSNKSVPVSVCCGVSIRRASSNNGAGGTSSNSDQRAHDTRHTGYHIPMLASQDISVAAVRVKLEDKRSKFVEIVDLKCGRMPGKVCSGRPISNNAKKLTFSRLSASD